MNTTTLYAELIVVGSGAAISVLLFFYSLFGEPAWFSKIKDLSSIGSLVSLVPVLSVIYLLGIVINNVGYLLFKLFDKSVSKDGLWVGSPDYNKLRNTLYTSANVTEFIKDFEFRRSKIRICRGWVINSALIIIALLLCLYEEKIEQPGFVWFWIIIVGVLLLCSGVSWWVTTMTELERLKSFQSGNTQATNPKI